MINCLNFLKKKRLNKCCNMLQKSVKLTEEKKMMNKLYNQFIDGKFSECITELNQPKLFQKYINKSKITYKWKRIDLIEKEVEFNLNFLSKFDKKESKQSEASEAIENNQINIGLETTGPIIYDDNNCFIDYDDNDNFLLNDNQCGNY